MCFNLSYDRLIKCLQVVNVQKNKGNSTPSLPPLSLIPLTSMNIEQPNIKLI